MINPLEVEEFGVAPGGGGELGVPMEGGAAQHPHPTPSSAAGEEERRGELKCKSFFYFNKHYNLQL